MKTCEICGRPIKSGYKYCWEHRHTAQANAVRGERVIDEATESYHKYKLYKLKRNYMLFLLAWLIPLILIGILFAFLEIKVKISLTIIIITSIVLLFYCIIIAFKLRVRNPSKDINTRHPEYIKWVKEWVGQEKEEKEFKRSLLK